MADYIKFPLTSGKEVIVRISTIQVVYQDMGTDEDTCRVSTTNKKQGFHSVALSMEKMEELLCG